MARRSWSCRRQSESNGTRSVGIHTEDPVDSDEIQLVAIVAPNTGHSRISRAHESRTKQVLRRGDVRPSLDPA